MLAARDLRVSLGARDVLRGVDLDVGDGEVVALVAPSGTGKTTLLRALVRLVPASGTVTLDGEDVVTMPPTALRRAVGFVAQTPVMLPGTVADNLAHGVADPDLGTLDAVGLDASLAPRDAGELSGGERARVALARALTRAPRVLLLDEPTGALDREAADRVGETLRGLGLGILVATHDEVFASRWCDRRASL